VPLSRLCGLIGEQGEQDDRARLLATDRRDGGEIEVLRHALHARRMRSGKLASCPTRSGSEADS
jgi:hypothetical protein